jgi:1-deoxy-D-xylulose-5-phosphate reductoisomerase
LPKLEFFKPDFEKFPCLNLAYRALRAGGTAPAVLNAANEVAVEAFLNNGIAYREIPQIIESVLDAHTPQNATDLETVLKTDSWARDEARIYCQSPDRAASRG